MAARGAKAVVPTKPPDGKAKAKKKSARSEWVLKLRAVARAFIGEGFSLVAGAPEPSVLFHVLADDEGVRRIVRVDVAHRVVAPVADDEVHAHIERYMQQLVVVSADFAATTAPDLRHVRELIVGMSPSMPEREILPIAWKSQEGYTYRRLPYDFVAGDSGATMPTWESVIERCTNSRAICAFIGSLFDPKSSRLQFVYLYGPGNEGKGCVIEALSEALGSAHTNQSIPGDGAVRFWAASVYNKRLVTFSECDRYDFATSEVVKALTGNDTTTIDRKGKDLFKATAICKFLFASNVKPNVLDTPAHRRRFIYSEIAPWSGEAVPAGVFIARLVAEMPAFLSACWEIYRADCPERGVIPVERDCFDRLAHDANGEFEELLERYFIVSEHLHCKTLDVGLILSISKQSANIKKPFIRYLATKGFHTNNRYVVGDDGKQTAVWGIWGIAPNPKYLVTKQYRKPGVDEKYWGIILEKLGMPKNAADAIAAGGSIAY